MDYCQDEDHQVVDLDVALLVVLADQELRQRLPMALLQQVLRQLLVPAPLQLAQSQLLLQFQLGLLRPPS